MANSVQKFWCDLVSGSYLANDDRQDLLAAVTKFGKEQTPPKELNLDDLADVFFSQGEVTVELLESTKQEALTAVAEAKADMQQDRQTMLDEFNAIEERVLAVLDGVEIDVEAAKAELNDKKTEILSELNDKKTEILSELNDKKTEILLAITNKQNEALTAVAVAVADGLKDIQKKLSEYVDTTSTQNINGKKFFVGEVRVPTIIDGGSSEAGTWQKAINFQTLKNELEKLKNELGV